MTIIRDRLIGQIERPGKPPENIRLTIDRVSSGVVGIETVDNVNKTLVVGANKQTQIWDTALTANRTVTLSTANATDGDSFKIVNRGLGAFTLDVGGLKTIPVSTEATVVVEFDGSAWQLTGYSEL